MNQIATITRQNTLILPEKIIRRYKTSKFNITPLEDVLIVEPEDDGRTTFELTSKEESKLEKSVNETSLPIAQLKRG